MKTDDLISMLAREPSTLATDARAQQRAWLLVGAAALVSFALMAYKLGINPRLRSDVALPMFWVKTGFVLALAFCFGYALTRLGRPGRRATPMFAAAGLFALMMWAMGMVAGFAGDREVAYRLVTARWAIDCPISIAALSVPLFAASFWLMRQLAPTRLTLSGATAGLFSGAVAAAIYALYCPVYHPSYVALWYSVGVLIPGLVGAALGRWLLRW
jgi:hypothetical protein